MPASPGLFQLSAMWVTQHDLPKIEMQHPYLRHKNTSHSTTMVSRRLRLYRVLQGFIFISSGRFAFNSSTLEGEAAHSAHWEVTCRVEAAWYVLHHGQAARDHALSRPLLRSLSIWILKWMLGLRRLIAHPSKGRMKGCRQGTGLLDVAQRRHARVLSLW